MATEIVTKKDYQKIERLGLLPTDRDPSAWLRMVARVFAAYKQVSLDKSIVAYISGFWILNQDLIEGTDVKFVIQKGTCFIDDQFIGFTDDILFKFPKNNLIPGNTYFLVLYYQWSYEFDYNLAEFQVIEPDLYDDQTMLRIASFEYTTTGEINLFPQDLDDQYADNFKKLFEIAKDKIIDSIETMKYHYEVFDPNENKIDPTVKSGDFVYLDYIDGKYKPARACTKEFDKAVGLYLKNNNNNKDYIIYEGIVDLSEPKWQIDDDRIYLRNLEPGTSYYLADGCTSSEVIQDAEYYNTQEQGKISTYFFPGTVRVGYALDITKLFVKIDYTADLTIQNLIELFGDSPRFWQIYQDFYKFYGYQGQLKYLIDKATEANDFIQTLTNLINTINDDISTLNSDLNADKNNLSAKDQTLSAAITTANDAFKSNLNEVIQYTNQNKFEQFNLANIISLQNLSDINTLLDNIQNKINNYIIEMDDKSNNTYKDLFSNINYTVIKNVWNNIKGYLGNIKNYLTDAKVLIQGSSDNKIKYISSSTVVITPFYKIIEDIKNNALSDNPQDFDKNNIETKLNNLYNKDNNGNDIGYFSLFRSKLDTDVNNIKTSTITANSDQSNHLNYNYSIQIGNSGSITYTSYNFVLTKSNCPDSNSQINKTLSFTKFSDSKSVDSNYHKCLQDIYEITAFILKVNSFLKNLILFLINKINILKNELNKYEYDFSNLLTQIANKINDLSAKNQAVVEAFDNYQDALKAYLQDKESLNYKNYSLAYLNHLLNTESQKTLDIEQEKTNIQNEIANLNNLLYFELQDDLLTPAKNIFTLSNYQRKIYNYTYLTQRIKIKQFELKKISDDLEIINNEIIKVQTTVPINQGLLEELNSIKGAFTTVQNEIEKELDSMVAEYNNLRTEFFGLDPISKDDIGFDPGPYFVTDLECLELKE